jgi:hypothetical protein
MLYATEGVDSPNDFNKAMVGVASIWCVLSFDGYYRQRSLSWLSLSGTKAIRMLYHLFNIRHKS